MEWWTKYVNYKKSYIPTNISYEAVSSQMMKMNNIHFTKIRLKIQKKEPFGPLFTYWSLLYQNSQMGKEAWVRDSKNFLYKSPLNPIPATELQDAS